MSPAVNRGRVLKGLGSSAVARLGMAAVNFALFWWLSHSFGSDALGGYSLLMNLFLLLQMMPLLGLSVPLARRVAVDEAGRGSETSNALAFALPVAVVIALGLVLVGRYAYPPWMFGAFCLLALAILPSAWTLVAESTLLGLERASDIARVQFAEAALRCLAAVLTVRLGGGLTEVFLVFAVLRLGAAVAYARHPALPTPRWQALAPALLRRNVREVPVYFGIALLAGLTMRLDVIVLSHLGDLHAVGQYAAAARLYEASLMLPTLAAVVLMPTLARLFNAQPVRFAQSLRMVLVGSLTLGMAAALGVAALASPIIELLYPAALADAAPVLRWLIFAAVWVTADQLLSTTMIAAQAQVQDLQTMALALGTLSVGLVLAVPSWGPEGAAAAVLAALIVRVVWRLRWAARQLDLPKVWPDLGRVGLATAAGLAGLWVGLRHGPWQALLLSLAAYALAARLCGLVGAHPLQDVKGGLGRLLGRVDA